MSERRSAFPLPPELCYAIIDELRFDKCALSACSLVCKSWVPRTRSLSFLDTLIRLRPSSIESLCSLLESPNCTIIPYIRQISLLEPLAPKELAVWERGIHLLDQILVRGRVALTRIILLGVPSHVVFESRLIDHLSPTLTYLDMNGGDIHYRNTEDLSGQLQRILRCISSFTELEEAELTLRTYQSTVIQPVQPVIFQKWTGTRLRKLKLDIPLNAFLPSLLVPGQVSWPGITHLYICIASSPLNVEPDLLQAFFDTLCAGTLQHLFLYFMYQTVPVIDFSQFKALRSVSFCTYSSSRNGSRHQKIASSVSTIRVPHAVEIYIADKYFQLPSSDDNLRWLYGKNREEW